MGQITIAIVVKDSIVKTKFNMEKATCQDLAMSISSMKTIKGKIQKEFTKLLKSAEY